MLSQNRDNSLPIDNAPPRAAAAEKENRRIQRISLPLPARVEVIVDKSMNWNEITRLSDVSAFGACFVLKKPIKRGRLIQITLPMPRQLRSYDYSEPQYKVWALVRRCIQTESITAVPEYSISVAFAGKKAPPGFFDHPSMLYDIATRDENSGLWHLVPADLMADESNLPKDQRKQTRLNIPETLRLDKVDDASNVVASEMTVTENISLGGAVVFTTMDLATGSFLRVTSERLGVTILSVVRNARTAADGIKRAHIEFIDRFFPLEGIT